MYPIYKPELLRRSVTSEISSSKFPQPNINLTEPAYNAHSYTLIQLKELAMTHFKGSFLNENIANPELKYFTAWAQSMRSVIGDAGYSEEHFIDSLNRCEGIQSEKALTGEVKSKCINGAIKLSLFADCALE